MKPQRVDSWPRERGNPVADTAQIAHAVGVEETPWLDVVDQCVLPPGVRGAGCVSGRVQKDPVSQRRTQSVAAIAYDGSGLSRSSRRQASTYLMACGSSVARARSASVT